MAPSHPGIPQAPGNSKEQTEKARLQDRSRAFQKICPGQTSLCTTCPCTGSTRSPEPWTPLRPNQVSRQHGQGGGGGGRHLSSGLPSGRLQLEREAVGRPLRPVCGSGGVGVGGLHGLKGRRPLPTQGPYVCCARRSRRAAAACLQPPQKQSVQGSFVCNCRAPRAEHKGKALPPTRVHVREGHFKRRRRPGSGGPGKKRPGSGEGGSSSPVQCGRSSRDLGHSRSQSAVDLAGPS